MDNQHRNIKGYRELSQNEIDLMNRVKEQGAIVEERVEELRNQGYPDQRWVSIGATDLLIGFMALTRSIAQPDFF